MLDAGLFFLIHDHIVHCFISSWFVLLYLGIAQIYFAVCSWLWTLVLSYTIYCVISNGKIWFQLWHAQCLCWILPLILALLPMSTCAYSSGDPDLQWCLIVPLDNYPPIVAVLWAFASFFMWMFVCILLMVYWGLMIQWRYWGSIASPIVRRTYEKVWLYPVALSLCWLLNVACVFVPNNNQTPIFYGLSTICGLSNGILNTVIFMRYNGEILQRWVAILQDKKEPSTDRTSTVDSSINSSRPSEDNGEDGSSASDVVSRQSGSRAILRDSNLDSFSATSPRETIDLIGDDWYFTNRDSDASQLRPRNSFTASIIHTASSRSDSAAVQAVMDCSTTNTSANCVAVEMIRSPISEGHNS